MQPGQRIEIQLVDDAGRPVRLGNVLMSITLYTGVHRRYVFDLRPTQQDGSTAVCFAELDTLRKEEGLYSLMDYNTPLTACDPVVEISVPSETELRKREEGIWQWNPRTVPVWLLKWPVNGCLAPVRPKRVTMEGTLTHIDIIVSLPMDIPAERGYHIGTGLLRGF